MTGDAHTSSAQEAGRQVRIAVVLAHLRGAGIQRMRINLMQALLLRGYQVDLVVGDGSGQLRQNVPEGVAVFEVARSGSALYPFGLLRYLIGRRPTHLMSSYEDISVMTSLLLPLLRSRAALLISTHNALSQLPAEAGLANRLKHALLFPLMRRLYPRAASLVAVSRGVVDELVEIAGVSRDRVKVIYNPVIGEDFPRRAAEPPPSGLQHYMGTPLIGYFGRLHPQKDLPILVRAFTQVRRQRPCRLLLVGEGAERARLEQMAGELGVIEDVIFWGFSDNPLPLMKACALVVLPSRYEGLGNVLIEAMACGVQVMSTDCPHGPAEILQRGVYGQLVPVGSIDAMAAAIVRSLDRQFWVDPQALVARGMEYSAAVACDKYLEALGLAQGGTIQVKQEALGN